MGRAGTAWDVPMAAGDGLPPPPFARRGGDGILQGTDQLSRAGDPAGRASCAPGAPPRAAGAGGRAGAEPAARAVPQGTRGTGATPLPPAPPGAQAPPRLGETPEPWGSALPLSSSATTLPQRRLLQSPSYSLHMWCVWLWHGYLYKFLFAGFIKYPLGVGLGGGDPDAQEEMFHISRSAVCAPRQPLPPTYQM